MFSNSSFNLNLWYVNFSNVVLILLILFSFFVKIIFLCNFTLQLKNLYFFSNLFFYFNCCYLFWIPTKKKIENTKSQKNNSSEKRMLGCPENGQKLVEKVQKYKDWNLTIYFLLMRALLTKNIQFKEEKSKIRYLWT